MSLALAFPLAGTYLTNAPIVWTVSTLIYNLGLFYCFTIGPRRAWKTIAYFFAAAVFFIVETSYFSSYYLQNKGFNEAFFYHLRLDLIYAGVMEHLPALLAMIACLVGFLITTSHALGREKPRRALAAPLAMGLLVCGLTISPSVKSLVHYAGKSTAGIEGDALYANFKELRSPQVTAHFARGQKPNIVLIYAESLEQRYFDNTVFPGLVPNLKKLREQSVDFTNVAQGAGADWTIAGMAASQCGYPLVSSHDLGGNEMNFFDEFMPKATCLGDLLQGDGYHLAFIGGADARFAGKNKFLASHGYREIIDHDLLEKFLADKSYQHQWGVYDDTLFDFAFLKFMELGRQPSPFLMTLLTLDTHHPRGFPSGSCGTYGSGDNISLNAVHCSDQLIPRFIQQIRNSPFSQNTLIIVASDHLAMRNEATSLLEESTAPGRLTFFVNTPDGKKGEVTNPGLHYDIAPTILDLAGYDVDGQMGFGSPLTRGPGYLPAKFSAEGWKDHEAQLLAIGKTLWRDDVTLDQEGIRLVAAQLTLTMGGREFDLSSDGVARRAPASTLFIFDDQSLKLEKVESFPFDEGLTPEKLPREMLHYNGKLVLAITRAKNLQGFTDPRNDLDRGAYFFGKPGGEDFSWGPLTGDLIIPFELIDALSRSKFDERVVQEHETQLTTGLAKVNAAKRDE